MMPSYRALGKKVFAVSKYVFLVLLLMFGTLWVGVNVGIKRSTNQEISNIELMLFRIWRGPKVFFERLQNPREFTAGEKQLVIPAPKARKKLYRIGKDPIPLDKNLLYRQYDYQKDQVRVVLRNLASNEVLREWTLSKEQLKKEYRTLHKQVRASKKLQMQAPFFLEEDMSAERVHQDLEIQHPLLLPDGRLVIKIRSPKGEHHPVGYLLCLSPEGQVLWRAPKILHHALELGPQNQIWGTSWETDTLMANNDEGQKFHYKRYTIVRFNQDGQMTFEKSIEDIYRANPAFPNPFTMNITRYDRFHLNEVQPVGSDGPYWKKGDVFLSLRQPNTLLLYRPSTNKILWEQSGPWKKQHDVRIVNDSLITVFSNNLVRDMRDIMRPRGSFLMGGHNQLYFYDFGLDSAYTLPALDSVFARNTIATPTEGRGKWFPQDSLLFTEATDQGKLVLHDGRKNQSYTLVIPAPNEDSNFVQYPKWCRLLEPSYGKP